MGCSPQEGLFVTWGKILGGIGSVAYGALMLMAVGFDVAQYEVPFYIQHRFSLAINCIFGLLLFLSSGCRTEHVTNQFRFLDTHYHLAWFHCFCAFLAFDGGRLWNSVPLGLIVAIMHW